MSAVKNWTDATAGVKWGVQQAIKTSLELVASGDIKMCHSSDDYNGAPCLINSINQMISQDANAGPSQTFPQIVMSFDSLNSNLYKDGVNTEYNMVSPLAAEIMLKHMGTLKATPEPTSDLTPEQFQEWARGRRSSESQSQAFENIVDELLER